MSRGLDRAELDELPLDKCWEETQWPPSEVSCGRRSARQGTAKTAVASCSPSRPLGRSKKIAKYPTQRAGSPHAFAFSEDWTSSLPVLTSVAAQVGEQIIQDVQVEPRRAGGGCHRGSVAEVGLGVVRELMLGLPQLDQGCLEALEVLLERGLGRPTGHVHEKGVHVELDHVEGGLDHLRLGGSLGAILGHRLQ